MVHFSQYPTVKVPVKLNAVNFEGVFNNIKLFQDQTPTQSSQGQSKQSLPAGPGFYQGNDMSNLIQVSSLQMGSQEQSMFGVTTNQVSSTGDKSTVNSNGRRPSTKSNPLAQISIGQSSLFSANQKLDQKPAPSKGPNVA